MTDARFEDASGAGPLRLRAVTAEDVPVLSALVQDSVFPVTEMRWDRPRRRFALLLNRFRWEDRTKQPERVQTVLAFEDVQAVQTQGLQRDDASLVLSLLSVAWEPGEDGTGRVVLTLAGDGLIGVSVETLELTLRDVTKPYIAPSGAMPFHPD